MLRGLRRNKIVRVTGRAIKVALLPAFVVIWVQAGPWTALWAAPALVLLLVGLSLLGFIPLGGPVLYWWLADRHALPWFFDLTHISPDISGENVPFMLRMLLDIEDTQLRTAWVVAFLFVSIQLTLFSSRYLTYVLLVLALSLRRRPIVVHAGEEAGSGAGGGELEGG